MPLLMRNLRDLGRGTACRGRDAGRRRVLAVPEACEDRTLLATAFGLTAANTLIRFDTATPGTVVSSVPIAGLAGGETALGIDFRPATGELFALGSTSRLYAIDYTTNPASAVATQVGVAGAFTLSGTEFGFDFNPTVDRIRVVSDTNQDLRLDPNSGALTATDTPLAYAAADVNAGADPDVVGSAYTNSINGATTTTLYGIDVARSPDVLVTQNPPNAGTLNTVGSLGVDSTAVLGFDIRGGTNTAYATLVVGGTPGLYLINLTTGAATLIGPVDAGLTVRGLAIAPEGFANTTLAGTAATFDGGPACDTIAFDQSGGLLRHNRFSAGDPGFASDFDFDPTTPGDQTLSATDPAVTIIVNGGACDDRITIGSASAPASGLAASFQVNGQGGGDRLTILDTADATARTITINGATSTISGLGGPITYGTLENVTLNAGTGGDRINVTGTAAAVTNINAGGGDDTVAFGAGATLSGGFADGDGGTNTLDYSAYTTAVTVDLSPAQAQTLFQAILSGAQEPGPLSNSPATGLLVGTLNVAQTALAFNISYQGLTGSPISGTHFHNQAVGVNGPIVRGLFPSEQNGLVTPSGTFSGVWSNSDPTLTPPDPAAPGAPVRPLNAPSPVTPGSTLVQELLAGRIYFNIHTLPNFPSGEVRGQLFSQGTVNPATGTGGVRGFANVTGGSNNDALTGDASVNVLRGGPGNDTVVGGQGGDQVFGDAGNDTLVWNNGDGSDFMEGGPDNDTVQVNGSPAGGDQFLIQVNPADPTRLRFDRTNLGLFNLNIGTTEALDFNTLGGDDTTTVDFAGGNPIPPGGIDYDGGTGDEGTPTPDRLVLQRSAGTFVATNEVYTATGPGAGVINVDGRTVAFSNLAPVDDVVPTINFTFTAPAGSAAIDVVDGPIVLGFPTTQINDAGTGTFELTNLANKTNITVNSASGAQAIVVNNPTAPSGVATLTINVGPAEDQVSVVAAPPGVALTVNTLGGNDTVGVTGAGVPTGTTALLDGGPGIDALNYDAGGGTVVVTPGPLPGQTTITRVGSGSVVYQNFEQVNVFNANPPPTVVVTPTPPLTAVEGRPLIDVAAAQFTADPSATPDQYDVTINWGDGTSPGAGTVAKDPVNPALYIVTGSHTYESPGVFTVTVTVRDEGRTTTSFINGVPVTITTLPAATVTATGATITVADAPLQADGATVSAREGQSTGPVTVATFLDTGGAEPVGTYTVAINWGDGTTTPGATITPIGTSPAGTTFRVESSHTYAREGTFPIAVTITSAAGSAAVAHGQAVVADALVAVGAPRLIVTTAGTPANNEVVAAFADAGIAEPVSDYDVRINWGDGSPSSGGLIVPSGSGFDVRGSHTFIVPGTFTGSVTVHAAGGDTLTIPFTAISNPVGITCFPSSVTEDQVLNNVVLAQLSPAGGPPLAPNFYTATIDWGDGTAPSPGTVDPTGRVLGSHAYSESGQFTIQITVGIPDNPNIVVGTCPQGVADRPIGLTGRLEAASDTGVSQTDRITNDNTPTFFGTSEPGSTVRIYRATLSGGRTLLSKAVADAAGIWRTTLIPLPDGTSSFTAEATDRNGVTKATISLGPVFVDTVGPRVTDLIFDRLTGRIGVAFQDDRSGLDATSLIDGANYRFTGRSLVGPRRNGPFAITSIQAAGATGPTTARGVTVTINNGQAIRGGTFTFVVRSGGVQDVAGNALDGEFYGFLPSGNRRVGGDFVAGLDSIHRIAFAPKPIQNGFATPLDPPGRPAQGFVIGRGTNQFVAATTVKKLGQAHPSGSKLSATRSAQLRARPATKS